MTSSCFFFWWNKDKNQVEKQLENGKFVEMSSDKKKLDSFDNKLELQLFEGEIWTKKMKYFANFVALRHKIIGKLNKFD